MPGAAKDQGSPFWQFSLAFYGRPGVAEACLTLQDQCGVDVNLLLFLIWLGLARRQLSSEELRAIETQSRGWAQSVVAPLRAARRALKGGWSFADGVGAESLRAEIKAIELEAERLEQEALYRLAQNPSLGVAARSADAAACANIKSYETLLGRAFTDTAVNVLFAAIRSAEVR